MQKMRLFLLLCTLSGFFGAGAQTYMPPGARGYGLWQPFHGFITPGDSNHLQQKWFLTPYAGISAGFGYFNGIDGTFISAPVGIQLNHPVNNNLIAFAGVSAAPSFYNFNSAFINPNLQSSYPGNTNPNAYGLGVNTRAELGLMYMNDAKTFSISGSIGVERSSYPVFPVYSGNRAGVKRQ